MRSSVSLPLTVNDATIGVVDLYSRARNSFGKKDIRRAEALTLQAATALTLLLRYARQTAPGAALPGEDVWRDPPRTRRGTRNIAHRAQAGGFDALVIGAGSGAGRRPGYR